MLYQALKKTPLSSVEDLELNYLPLSDVLQVTLISEEKKKTKNKSKPT